MQTSNILKDNPLPRVSLTKELSYYQLAWRNDPRIHAWTRQNGMLSPSEHNDWLEKIEKDPTIQMFGILSASGDDVGTCGLTSISSIHGTAEFSLFIGPEEQGQGYGQSALIELLKYGFKNLRLNCIWGETFVNNPALEMFKNVGFSPEGVLRERYFKNGEYIDSVMVSIVASNAKEMLWWS